jgi:hypothetical protein
LAGTVPFLLDVGDVVGVWFQTRGCMHPLAPCRRDSTPDWLMFTPSLH